MTINLKLISSSIMELGKTPFSTKTMAGSFGNAVLRKGSSEHGLDGMSDVSKLASRVMSMGRPRRTSGVVPAENMDDGPRFMEHSMKRVSVRRSQRLGSLLEQPNSGDPLSSATNINPLIVCY